MNTLNTTKGINEVIEPIIEIQNITDTHTTYVTNVPQQIVEVIERGIQGASGLPPEHKWVGTVLTFKNADGTWGEPVDLQGSFTLDNVEALETMAAKVLDKIKSDLLNGTTLVGAPIDVSSGLIAGDHLQYDGSKWSNTHKTSLMDGGNF